MAGPVRASQPVSGRSTREAKSLPGGPIREHGTTRKFDSVAVANECPDQPIWGDIVGVAIVQWTVRRGSGSGIADLPEITTQIGTLVIVRAHAVDVVRGRMEIGGVAGGRCGNRGRLGSKQSIAVPRRRSAPSLRRRKRPRAAATSRRYVAPGHPPASPLGRIPIRWPTCDEGADRNAT